MNIGMFSDSYLPYASGVVRSIESFAKSLRKRGDKVYIVAPDYPGFEDNDSGVIRFPSYRFSRQSDFRLAPPFSRFLIEKIEQLDLDLIHSHSPFLLGNLALRLALKERLPIVFTYHTRYGEYSHYFKWLPQSTTKRLVDKHVYRYCRKCTTIISPSLAIKNILLNSGITTPIKVLPTGVDAPVESAVSSDDFRRKYGISPGAPMLLYVGRLGREKNLSVLLRAAAPTLKSKPLARLVLVGDGPWRRNVIDLANKLGVVEQIIITGILNRGDVVASYRAADLFVFSSLTETQGLVIGEALSCGLPVVAVSAPGVNEMVRNGRDGILTGPSSNELEAAIQRLLANNKQRRGMSKNALARASNLSSDYQAGALKRIYSALVEPSDIIPEDDYDDLTASQGTSGF